MSSRCKGRPAYKVKCWAVATAGAFCAPCAARERPGQVFYLARWRSRADVYQRIRGDRAMRGVQWSENETHHVGVLGTFEIRLLK